MLKAGFLEIIAKCIVAAGGESSVVVVVKLMLLNGSQTQNSAKLNKLAQGLYSTEAKI